MIALLLSTALSGTYVLDMHAASAAKVPVLGWQRSVTRTLALVTLGEDGAWRQEVCAVEVLDKAPLARTELPDAFVAALPITEVTAVIEGDALTVDLGLSRVGFSGDELPESADDPNLVDHEGDGRPGATVRLHITAMGTFGIDVVQLSRAVLHGERDGEGFSGRIETARLEQRVLSADHRMLATSPELRAEDEDSHFALVPTEAESCAEVVSSGE